jgi:hypothetical protein
MTPEFHSGSAHEACALLHWEAEEWDFWAWSEDNESLTNGEDLHVTPTFANNKIWSN